MALEYKIERKESFGEVRLHAKPNEWACDARVTVVLKDDWDRNDKTAPRIEHINWSTGARDWTIEDARIFFRAALEMLDVAEAELKSAPPEPTK